MQQELLDLKREMERLDKNQIDVGRTPILAIQSVSDPLLKHFLVTLDQAVAKMTANMEKKK